MIYSYDKVIDNFGKLTELVSEGYISLEVMKKADSLIKSNPHAKFPSFLDEDNSAHRRLWRWTSKTRQCNLNISLDEVIELHEKRFKEQRLCRLRPFSNAEIRNSKNFTRLQTGIHGNYILSNRRESKQLINYQFWYRYYVSNFLSYVRTGYDPRLRYPLGGLKREILSVLGTQLERNGHPYEAQRAIREYHYTVRSLKKTLTVNNDLLTPAGKL